MDASHAEEIQAREVIDFTTLGGGLALRRRTAGQLTKKRADELINMPQFVGERPLRDAHVDFLYDQMRSGAFRPEFVQIVTCWLGDVCYRMNGQHTCWARGYMPDEYACPVTFLEYEAATEHDMRRLYASIDRGAPRSRTNVTNAYMAGTEEYGQFSLATLRALPAGFAFWRWPNNTERRQQRPDVISYLLLSEYLQLGRKVATFLDTCPRTGAQSVRFMFLQPVVAGMFETFNRAGSMKALEEFWGGVRDGVNIPLTSDPRLQLRMALLNDRVKRSDVRGRIREDDTEVYYTWVLRCWNAFRSGKEIAKLQYRHSDERLVARK